MNTDHGIVPDDPVASSVFAIDSFAPSNSGWRGAITNRVVCDLEAIAVPDGQALLRKPLDRSDDFTVFNNQVSRIFSKDARTACKQRLAIADPDIADHLSRWQAILRADRLVLAGDHCQRCPKSSSRR